MEIEQLQALIREGLETTGLSERQASLRSTGSAEFIYGIKKGSMPSFDRACKLLKTLNLEFHIGPPPPLPPEIAAALKLPTEADIPAAVMAIAKLTEAAARVPAREMDALRREIAALRQAVERLGRDTGAKPPRIGEVAARYATDPAARAAEADPAARPVATVELAAAAGGGAYNLDEAPVQGQIWFRRAWLDERGLSAPQCVVISVQGESMEPTLPAGSKILVARGRRRRAGRVFVVNTDDGLVVKRLGKSAGGWQMLSDNPDPSFATRGWPANAEAVGEVLWMARNF